MGFGIKKYKNKVRRYLRNKKGYESQSLRLKEIRTKSELKDFVKFNIDLYDGDPYHVPLLISDEIEALTPGKNPALEFCDLVLYMVYRGDTAVGRIAGIINHRANEKWDQKRVRFGYLDFVDDSKVVDMLFGAVERWGKMMGCEEIHGPLGFTDLDREGMLIEGFDQLGTVVAIYNYPYYPKHMQRLGYKKDVDWQEYKIYVPKTVPERHRRVSDIVRKKYGVRVIHSDDKKQLQKKYGGALFQLINDSYSKLYGVTELTEKQIEYYIKSYLPLVKLDLLSLVVVEATGELIGFGLTLPSLSRALQKANGKLFPTGLIHLMSALNSGKADIIDLMLIGVRPDYQGKGVNALIFEDLIPSVNKYQVKYVESNPELEDNKNVQLQWNYFKKVHHKRRRCYLKSLKDNE